MKKCVAFVFAVLILFVLSGCSGVKQEDYDSALAAIEALTAQNEELQTRVELLENMVQSNLTASESMEITSSEESMGITSSELKSEDSWAMPLPDGISADIQLSDDKMTMYIVYTNNTGDAVSIGTTFTLGDDSAEPFMGGFTGCMYVADGAKYIEVIDSWDPIGSYMLQCELSRVYQSIRESNEAITIESCKNDDGSVLVTFDSTDGSTFLNGSIFYLDDDGKVLGYEPFGLGGMMPFDKTFCAPEYDYADYLIFCEAT